MSSAPDRMFGILYHDIPLYHPEGREEKRQQTGGSKRPKTVIAFEPLLIKAAGPEVTLLHADEFRSTLNDEPTLKWLLFAMTPWECCSFD